jgi:hypothetical protein
MDLHYYRRYRHNRQHKRWYFENSLSARYYCFGILGLLQQLCMKHLV